MREVLPGVFHWSSFHPGIRTEVGSHYVGIGGVATVIDPMEPEQGLDWFVEQGPPSRVVLTNRHHYRHSDRFVERFGCEVVCHRSGLHEFADGPAVAGFEFGDELAPGIVAHEVGAICAEDTALHVAAGDGALVFADALINYSGVGFVPDALIGDEPERVKRDVKRSVSRLLELRFDSLLFAHGEPLLGGGRAALEESVSESG